MRTPVPIQVQVAMQTISMLRHNCNDVEQLGEIEHKAEQATFRAACARLTHFLQAPIPYEVLLVAKPAGRKDKARPRTKAQRRLRRNKETP